MRGWALVLFCFSSTGLVFATTDDGTQKDNFKFNYVSQLRSGRQGVQQSVEWGEKRQRLKREWARDSRSVIQRGSEFSCSKCVSRSLESNDFSVFNIFNFKPNIAHLRKAFHLHAENRPNNPVHRS